MNNKNFKIYGDEIPPDDFSQDGGSQEKVINYDDQWADDSVPASDEKKMVDTGLVEKVAQEPSRAVSAPRLDVPEVYVRPLVPPTKVLVANKSKVGRKPTGRAMTNAQRQAKWRAANRDVALERQRAAMKKIRDAKKSY